MNDLLRVKNLDVSYGKEVTVKNAAFTVQKGQILGIVGESGSGKSTLLKAIMQLPATGVVIQRGNIFFQGQDLNNLSDDEKRVFRGSQMGVIFQNPGASLNPLRKIKKQFIETMQSHVKIDKREANQRILRLLEKLNLHDGQRVLESYPFELSGGMNQRVAIALAMIMEPKLLLADEPTSALDVTVQAQVVDEMMTLRREFGTAIVIVSHNIGVISKMADQIAVMYSGRIVEYGNKIEIIQNHRHPYTKALIEAIPRLNGRRPIGIPGQLSAVNDHKCSFADRCDHWCEQCEREDQDLFEVSKNHWSTCRYLDEG